MDLKVEEAKVNDLDQLNDLLRKSKTYWPAYASTIEAFMDRFSITPHYLQKNTIKLLYLDDELAGFFSFFINDESNNELDYFFIHPTFIGRGVGRKLWEICCKFAFDQGHKEFYILSNPFAEGFYLKMGCEKVGTRKAITAPGEILPFLKYVLNGVAS